MLAGSYRTGSPPRTTDGRSTTRSPKRDADVWAKKSHSGITSRWPLRARWRREVTTGRMAQLSSLWRNLVHRNRVDHDLDEELRAAVELLVDENVRAGMHPDDARRAARLELGSLESLKDQVRDARAGHGVDTLVRNIRFSLRLLRRAPGFTAIAI